MKTVNQRICPENITLTPDASDLIHLELSDMASWRDTWCPEAWKYSCYNKRVSPIEFGYNKAGFYQDRHSIGVIILELLAGTDVVLTAERPFTM